MSWSDLTVPSAVAYFLCFLAEIVMVIKHASEPKGSYKIAF